MADHLRASALGFYRYPFTFVHSSRVIPQLHGMRFSSTKTIFESQTTLEEKSITVTRALWSNPLGQDRSHH